MSETMALVRLAIARHRTVALCLIAIAIASQVIALLTAAMYSDVPMGDAVLAALGLTMFPTGLAALMLFDYGQTKNMSSAESGCDEWLLRMPVPSWKIALPPILLKTLWIATIWCALAITGVSFGYQDEVMRSLGPGICFAGGMIWLLFLAWRPFRSGWWRIGLLIAMLPAIYLALGAVIIAAQAENRHWYPWALLGAVVIYASGVWATIRAVDLARTNCRGIIPAVGTRATAGANEAYSQRDHLSAARALVWHDLLRTRGFIRYTIILGAVPAVTIFTLFIPLHAVTVFGAVLVFVYIGAIAMCGVGGNSSQDLGNQLPPYLVASPLKTSTLAWTRMSTIACGSLVMWSLILLVFAGWACWPENREVWSKWATERAIDVQAPAASAFSIGLRWSVAIVVSAAVFLLSRFIAFLWVGMVGRQWFSGVVGVVVGLWLLLVLGVVLRWFMQQTDWEGTMESMYSWATLIPSVVVGLLIAKAIAVVAATISLSKTQLATAGQIVRVCGIWILLTLALALSMTLLIPDPRATLAWCLAATALAIPLSRILILPISLSFNRHR